MLLLLLVACCCSLLLLEVGVSGDVVVDDKQEHDQDAQPALCAGSSGCGPSASRSRLGPHQLIWAPVSQVMRRS